MIKNIDDRLKELRKDIDEIDSEICQLIKERSDISLQIAKEKRTIGLPIENTARESEVLERCAAVCPKNEEVVRAVFSALIDDSKRIQRSRMNLYLVGMPNSGKTKLAGKLELLLNRKSVDMDALIMEQEGKSIDYIFDHFGEERFRIIENGLLIRLARHGGLIVATGGGILTHSANIPILHSSGVTVFLDRSPDGLVGAKLRNRPLIRGGAEAVVRLYKERIEQYRSNADLCVDPDNSESAKRIAEFYLSRIK